MTGLSGSPSRCGIAATSSVPPRCQETSAYIEFDHAKPLRSDSCTAFLSSPQPLPPHHHPCHRSSEGRKLNIYATHQLKPMEHKLSVATASGLDIVALLCTGSCRRWEFTMPQRSARITIIFMFSITITIIQLCSLFIYPYLFI